MGHEFSGVVEALGGEVDDLEVGDHVVVEPYIIDDSIDTGEASKTYHLSPHMNFIGLAGRGGGLSEKVAVKRRWVHKISQDIPLDQAALIEPLSVGFHAVERAGEIHPGDVALVGGAGPIGLLTAAVLKAKGATGVIVVVSIWGKPAQLDMQKLVLKEVDLRGTIAYVNSHPQTIELVESGKINLAPFLTGKIMVDDLIDKGFDTLIHRNETAVKILATTDESLLNS